MRFLLESSTLVLPVMEADQENADLFVVAVANIRSNAHGAMVVHTNGLADNSKKRSRGP